MIETIIHFFHRATGFTATPEQEQVLKDSVDSEVKTIEESCGRGWSKTLLGAIIAWYYADIVADELKEPIEVLLVTSQKRIWKHLNDLLRNNPDLKAKLKHAGLWDEAPVSKIELLNGSTIIPVMPTSLGVRSYRCDVLIIDEAQEVPNEVWNAILPTTTGEISKVFILGTPTEEAEDNQSLFIEYLRHPQKYGVLIRQFSAEEAPWQTESNKRLKNMLSPDNYQREVMGKLPKGESRRYFPEKHEKNIFKERSSDPESGANGYLEVGVDPAIFSGHTGVTIIEYGGYKLRKMLQCFDITGIEPFVAAKKIVGVLDEYKDKIKIRVIKVDSRPEVWKGALERYTKLPIFYVDFVKYKGEMYSQFLKTWIDHKLLCPLDKIGFREQVKRYTGVPKNIEKHRCDLIDSTALALFSCQEIEDYLTLLEKPPKETPRIVSCGNHLDPSDPANNWIIGIVNKPEINTLKFKFKRVCISCQRICYTDTDEYGIPVYCEKCRPIEKECTECKVKIYFNKEPTTTFLLCPKCGAKWKKEHGETK